MANDLKGYLKNNKRSEIDKKKAMEIESELKSKSKSELNSEFQAVLAKSKANGTFNKGEMLRMLSGIKQNMPAHEYQRIKSIIENL